MNPLVVVLTGTAASGLSPGYLELGGRTLADRAVTRVRGVLPGSSVVVSSLDGDLADVLDSLDGEFGAVLVVDPAHPFVADQVLLAVCEAVDADPAGPAVLAVCEVSDTIKRVDAEQDVTETVDRHRYVEPAGVLGMSPIVLAATLTATLPKGADLAELAATVDRVVGVRQLPVPGGARRIAEPAELSYAEAVLSGLPVPDAR